MFSSIGIRAWSVILSLVILALGLSGVTGFIRMAEQSGEVVDGIHAVEVLSFRLDAAVERMAGADTMSGESVRARLKSRIEGMLDQLETHAADVGLDSEVAPVKQAWDAYLADGGGVDVGEDSLQAMRQAVSNLQFKVQSDFTAARETMNDNFRYWSITGAVLTFLGLVLTLVFYYSTHEVVISPLDHVTRVIDRVNAGDTSLRIPEESTGAIRRLARSCNRLFEHLEKLLDEGRSQVNRRQRQALVLIEAFEESVVMTDDSGVIVLANSKARELLTRGGAAAIEEAIVTAVKEKKDVDVETCRVRYLNTDNDNYRAVLALDSSSVAAADAEPAPEKGKDEES